MQIVDDWLKRKLSDFYMILQPATVTHEWKRMAGRILCASVTLSATPAKDFSFVSRVQWPVKASGLYEEYVIDGIFDALVAPRNQGLAVLGIAVVLEQINWHEEGAVPLAFYMAAREATQKLIEGNIGDKAVPVIGASHGQTVDEQSADELGRLRGENEQLHQANMKLLLRQSEMIHEDHHVWQFVRAAKRFQDRLIHLDFHDASGEHIEFVVGLDQLKTSLKERLQDLEPTSH